MDIWIVRKAYALIVVAANTEEEAINTIIATRNEELWYGLMDEEDKESERRELVATRVILPSIPSVLAEYRE